MPLFSIEREGSPSSINIKSIFWDLSVGMKGENEATRMHYSIRGPRDEIDEEVCTSFIVSHI